MRRIAGEVTIAAMLVVVLTLGLASRAEAALAKPAAAWSIQSIAQPSSFSPRWNARCEEGREHCQDRYALIVTNVGSRDSSGTVTVKDVLPTGVTTAWQPEGANEAMSWQCETSTAVEHEIVTCTTETPISALTPAAAVRLDLLVDPSAAGSVTTHIEASGGEALRTAVNETVTPIEAAPSPFALAEFAAGPLDLEGMQATRAASHPGTYAASFAFPSVDGVSVKSGIVSRLPVENAKQIVMDLPPGLIGDALASPTCSLYGVANLNAQLRQCPAASQVGRLTLTEPGGTETELVIFNVEPENGVPAEFAVYLPSLQRAVVLHASVVGNGPEAHVRVISAPQDSVVEIVGVSFTFFGDPNVRDGGALAPAAFFTNPSDCGAPGFTSTIHVDSWQHPGRFEPNGQPDLSDPNWKSASSVSPPVSGCELLQFRPILDVQPTNTAPDSPTGLNVDLQVPQNEDPAGLATPPLKSATVSLPRGLVISPSAANGLLACSDQQFDARSNVPASCPQASQIGSVTVHTPILAEALGGQVYLGQPNCSPCYEADAQAGRLARLFIQVRSEQYGITLKIPGNVAIDPVTGQLTATFSDNPEQPFDDLKLRFPEGARATLSTPAACGTYTTDGAFTPWSFPGTPDATVASSFEIAPCGGNAFVPSFVAGTTRPQAGGYSPFTLTFSRSDGEQAFSSLEQKLPPGLLAKLATVPQCADAEANVGRCPIDSRIGTVTVGAGPGPSPYFTSGSAYLTGPYGGGPFGIAVIVQAVAGPFNLGTVVVRNSIHIDPSTTQVTVVSDHFPSALSGIPLQIRTVNVLVDRQAFTLNSTSCSPMTVTGKLTSTQGVAAPLASKYQATDCGSLSFKPLLTATTAHWSSKAAGASLDVRVKANGGPQQGGGEANIRSVKVDLPKQLPSRLTTLQKACLAAVFDVNPARCPKESDVGTAMARTPLLSNPLSGPAYLVSHGSEAFPDLEIVLQGEGIVLVLDGNTTIKKGVTSSYFKAVPDAPIASFELKLPTGRFSVLSPNLPVSAKYSFCGKRLSMPTTITAQNGAVVKQTVKIGITGCPKAKRPNRKRGRVAGRGKRQRERSRR